MATTKIYGVETEITCNVCNKPCSKSAINKYETSECQYACSKKHYDILVLVDQGDIDVTECDTPEQMEKIYQDYIIAEREEINAFNQK